MCFFCVNEVIFRLLWIFEDLKCSLCVCSPSDKPPEAIGMVNGETLKQVNILGCLLSVCPRVVFLKTFSLCQIPPSESPSPPPGLTKPSLVVPVSVSDLTARSPFEGAAAESQSLFSDNSNFRHPNPLPAGLPPFPTSPRSSSDWPMTPEPQSLFTSGTAFQTDCQPQTSTHTFSCQTLTESRPLFSPPAETIPVSSSTDWQAAFGFGSSSKQQDDDLGFDPFDVTRKALADLIEKELSVQDQSPTSPGPFSQGSGLPPPPHPSASHHFPSSLPRLPQLHHRPVYNSFSFPGGQNSQASQQQAATRHPWMGVPTRNNLAHLNHSASAVSHSNFLDLNLPPQHNTGLGGIPISGIGASLYPDWTFWFVSELCSDQRSALVWSSQRTAAL